MDYEHSHLYAIADALQVHIEAPYCIFPNTYILFHFKECPAFFEMFKNLYGYVYDGRINPDRATPFELHPEENSATEGHDVYKDFEDYDHIMRLLKKESLIKRLHGMMLLIYNYKYHSAKSRYNSIKLLYTNTKPPLNAETKWAVYRLSTRPVMPYY